MLGTILGLDIQQFGPVIAFVLASAIAHLFCLAGISEPPGFSYHATEVT
jgi:hypothetical protein